MDGINYHPISDDSSHPFSDGINYHPKMDDSSDQFLELSSIEKSNNEILLNPDWIEEDEGSLHKSGSSDTSSTPSKLEH